MSRSALCSRRASSSVFAMTTSKPAAWAMSLAPRSAWAKNGLPMSATTKPTVRERPVTSWRAMLFGR